MSWRSTIVLLLITCAAVAWSTINRPLQVFSAPNIALQQFTRVELLGDSGWAMSKSQHWTAIHPKRSRLSNFQVEQWIGLFEATTPCSPPDQEPTHTIRFSASASGPILDVPVWFDVVGPAKIFIEGGWYLVNSELTEPLRFGLAPFRTLDIVPPSLSTSQVKITVGKSTSVELVKDQSWSLREPLLAPADPGAIQAWLEAVEAKSATAILGEVSEDEGPLHAGLFPVMAELTLAGSDDSGTRTIRFGKRLSDGSRLAQIQGEDVIFVVTSDDASFMLTSPTRFLIPTCTTLAPERIHSIAVGIQAVRRNAVSGRFRSVGTQMLELLTSAPATNFALAASMADGAPVEVFDETGNVLFSGQIQCEGSQVAVWSEGLARILPASDNLISWIRLACEEVDQDRSAFPNDQGAD